MIRIKTLQTVPKRRLTKNPSPQKICHSLSIEMEALTKVMDILISAPTSVIGDFKNKGGGVRSTSSLRLKSTAEIPMKIRQQPKSPDLIFNILKEKNPGREVGSIILEDMLFQRSIILASICKLMVLPFQ